MNPQFQSALRTIYQRLVGQSINWAITGSIGFRLQGVAVAVHDIDLQTDRAGAFAIQQLFAPAMTRAVAFATTDRIRSYLGAFEIEGITVEIMGDIQKKLPDGSWETPVNLQDHRVWVTFDDMQLPVLSLQYEYEAYLKLGRLEKAARLRHHIEADQG